MYGRNRYKQAQARTAGPNDLIVMLYDGILRFVAEAITGVEAGDSAASGQKLSRALDIIAYLQAILRPDQAPELSATLDQTYLAWTTLLVRANLQRDVESMRAVRAQVVDLKSAWEKARDQLSGAARQEAA
jgi:flagellar protein FliS